MLVGSHRNMLLSLITINFPLKLWWQIYLSLVPFSFPGFWKQLVQNQLWNSESVCSHSTRPYDPGLVSSSACSRGTADAVGLRFLASGKEFKCLWIPTPEKNPLTQDILKIRRYSGIGHLGPTRCAWVAIFPWSSTPHTVYGSPQGANRDQETAARTKGGRVGSEITRSSLPLACSYLGSLSSLTPRQSHTCIFLLYSTKFRIYRKQ